MHPSPIQSDTLPWKGTPSRQQPCTLTVLLDPRVSMQKDGAGCAQHFQMHQMPLCDALATSARRIADEYVDPTSVEVYVASRLIPLN